MRLHGVDVYSHDLSLFIIGFYTGPNLLPYEFEVKCTAENSTCLAESEGAAPDAAAATERRAIFDRLGVRDVPVVPLDT